MSIERDFDRYLIDALLVALRVLAANGVALSARKPMFELMTPDGPVCPEWQVNLAVRGETLPLVLSTQREEHDEPRRRALDFLGHVLDVDSSTIERLTLSLLRIARSRKIMRT